MGNKKYRINHFFEKSVIGIITMLGAYTFFYFLVPDFKQMELKLKVGLFAVGLVVTNLCLDFTLRDK